MPTKSYSQLINNVIGQLNGIDRMINDQKDCFQTLTQMKAARSAMNTLMNRFMQENFESCLLSCKRKGEQEDVCKKFFNEIIQNS
ncbi:MAG: metal-sensitive transcriptional regulator [Patescibacteria group bacterium]|jgi:DNA-binding FrmR family transcriptional regulator